MVGAFVVERNNRISMKVSEYGLNFRIVRTVDCLWNSVGRSESKRSNLLDASET